MCKGENIAVFRAFKKTWPRSWDVKIHYWEIGIDSYFNTKESQC